jgi:ribosomal protein L20
MPQIWMTYGEIAALLGCETDDARIQAAQRSLDRKKSHDGLTRVKLDLLWMAKFYAAIRDADAMLDQAIRDLQIVHIEMNREGNGVARPNWMAR